MNSIRKIEEEFLGLNHRNVGYIFPSNERKHYKLADDKVESKRILELNDIQCARTYAVISKIGNIPGVLEKMKAYKSLAIKPANGSGGEGIKILRKNQDDEWTEGDKVVDEDALHLYLANIIMGVYSLTSTDKILIEECINPHNCFHDIFPKGVADFRVILYKEEIALAMLRMPAKKSDGKANLHQGGIGIGVDINTGKMTMAYDGEKYTDHHPDTGAKINGVQLPFWEEILALSLKTAKHFPLKYLGVDIVIDKLQGPLVMEVNVRPGLGIQMVNKQGLRPILEKIDEKIKKGGGVN